MNICEICGTNFSLARNLARHVKAVHNKIKDYICRLCNKGFTDSYKLKYHQYQHSNVRNFQCEECSKSFKTNSDLNQHRKIHDKHKELRLVCPNCPNEVIFSDRKEFTEHSKIHIAEKREQSLTCQTCHRKFSRGYKLRDHIKAVHEKTKDYECIVCLKTFARRDNLRAHMVLHTAEKIFECEWCDFKGKTKTYLVRHQRVCKNRDRSGEIQEMQLDETDRVFVLEHRPDSQPKVIGDDDDFNYDDNDHQKLELELESEKTHEEMIDANYQIEYVEDDPSVVNLDGNMVFLMDTEKCEKIVTDCDVKFSEAFSLDFRKGSSDEHYCSMCNKFFSRPYNLVRHIISVHENYKENVTEIYCKYCTNFLDRTNYINHLVLKKFTCSNCQKFFTVKGHWMRHETKCSTFNQPKECSICGKVVANEYRLNAHVKIMHTEKPFACKICEEQCVSQVRLKKHMHQVHKDGLVRSRRCGYCLEEFLLASEFFKHIDDHSDSEICRVCGDYFQSATDLTVHTTIHWKHTQLPEYVCDHCGCLYHTKANLKSHIIENHLISDRHICNFCGLTLQSKEAFKYHLKKHENESNNNQLICEICNRKFATKMTLSVHQRQHNFEEPYKCRFCNKTFKSYQALNSHLDASSNCRGIFKVEPLDANVVVMFS